MKKVQTPHYSGLINVHEIMTCKLHVLHQWNSHDFLPNSKIYKIIC